MTVIHFSLCNAGTSSGSLRSATVHNGAETRMSDAHKASSHDPYSTVSKHHSRVSGAILLRLARRKTRFKASAFNDSAFERLTNSYDELDIIEYEDETQNSQTYATTNENTDSATTKSLS